MVSISATRLQKAWWLQWFQYGLLEELEAKYSIMEQLGKVFNADMRRNCQTRFSSESSRGRSMCSWSYACKRHYNVVETNRFTRTTRTHSFSCPCYYFVICKHYFAERFSYWQAEVVANLLYLWMLRLYPFLRISRRCFTSEYIRSDAWQADKIPSLLYAPKADDRKRELKGTSRKLDVVGSSSLSFQCTIYPLPQYSLGILDLVSYTTWTIWHFLIIWKLFFCLVIFICSWACEQRYWKQKLPNPNFNDIGFTNK
jgi:hypothetical protein